MSDQQDYTPPEPVGVYEEVVDNPARPYKAYASALVGGIGAAIAWWIGDEDPFTKKDAGEALLAGLAVAVPGFGVSWTVKNPKVTKPLEP